MSSLVKFEIHKYVKLIKTERNWWSGNARLKDVAKAQHRSKNNALCNMYVDRMRPWRRTYGTRR